VTGVGGGGKEKTDQNSDQGGGELLDGMGEEPEKKTTSVTNGVHVEKGKRERYRADWGGARRVTIRGRAEGVRKGWKFSKREGWWGIGTKRRAPGNKKKRKKGRLFS